jgi:hypothetical protein
VVDSSFVIDATRCGIMAGWRQAVELAITDEEIALLTNVSRSRTERASRVERPPSSHRRYAGWTPDRFRRWGRTIGPNTEALISAPS